MITNDDRPGADNAEATNEPSAQAADNITRAGVFRVGAPLYRDAGWLGVLPLPPAQKFPPLKGYTGHDGSWPTDDETAEWIQNTPKMESSTHNHTRLFFCGRGARCSVHRAPS